jgi:hypothetical protein
MINLRKTLVAGSLGLIFAAIAAPAAAQYYTLNGQTPPPSVAQYMAANMLPSGDYWLTNEGYWGVMGSNATRRSATSTPGALLPGRIGPYRNGGGCTIPEKY